MQNEGVIININGQMHQTSISVMDYGLLYGFGLFETMRAYNGHVFRMDSHLDRIHLSAEMLQWELPWTSAELAEQVQKTLAAVSKHNAYVRLSVTRGTGTGFDLTNCVAPSYVIMVRAYHGASEQAYQRGWHVLTSSIRRNSTSPLSRVKSLNYADNILAKQEAMHKGADEGLLLNEAGHVAEGCTSNIFVVRNGVLRTPSLECGILNGITRQVVLEIAQKVRLSVCQQQLLPSELYAADEIFCTNSLMEIMPVTQWEKEVISRGAQGPITGFIREQYRQWVAASRSE